MDFYAAPGTPVAYHAYPVGTSDYWAVVWAIVPTCNNGAPGGSTVFIDVYVNGTWEGYIAYGHLASVQVVPGQVVSAGTVLGNVHQWGYSAGCYEVSNDDGVHSHIEMYNSYRYACYIDWGSGIFLWYGSDLGRIGRIVYAAPQQAC